MSSLLLAAVLTVFAVSSVNAAARQQPSADRLVLDRPDRTIEQKFSLIQGARETADGRLIISDFIEDRIAIIDFGSGTVSDRNRTGPGPDEFRLPGALRAFRGDSTLLIDMGNARVDVLDADGRIRRSLRPTSPGASYPAGADLQGRLYFAIPSWSARTPLAGDTVELAVWDPATDETGPITRIHGMTWAPQPRAPQDGPRLPMVVFADQDSWAVSADGRIAIISGADYVVRWLADGRVVATGPSYATPRKRVTARDRTDYVRDFARSSPVSGRGEDGGLGHAPAEQNSPAEIEGLVRRSTFAETLPLFRAGDARIDRAGRLWVGATTAIDEPRRYDVFDGRARRIASIELARGRRLIAIGARHVYVVVSDEDGLETIERLPLPALAGA